MSGKRSADSGRDQPRVKRSRFDSSGLNGSIEAVKSSAENGRAAAALLQKARDLKLKKEALQAQIQALKEKKSGVPGLGLGATGVAPAKQPSFRPAPLKLDEQGREIDDAGKIVERHQQQPARQVGLKGVEVKQEAEPEGPKPQDFFDPALETHQFQRLQRKQRTSFDFVKAGTFQKVAEQQRLKAVFGEQAFKKERRQSEKRVPITDSADPNLVPLGERPASKPVQQPEPIPDVEWWDSAILEQPDSYYGVDGNIYIKEKRIDIYIEHPVPLEPPAEEPPAPPMPLPLTAKATSVDLVQERKKLRTQRRVEKEKEKQELIRQGLLEPPKPKVKLSTFHRSLGLEAVADPTAVEQQVRADQEARQQAHEDRNLAQKLTPAERREKKIRKLTGAADEGESKSVSVYYVNSLAGPQQRFKVRANAEELHMTGCAIVTDGLAFIVVEGGVKAQKKYAHIVLNRINWNSSPDDADDSQDRVVNKCMKVWSGIVKEAAFERFMIETCHTEAAARKFLADRNVAHYWDLAYAQSIQAM